MSDENESTYLPVELARRTVILPDGAMVAAVAAVAEDGPVTLHVSCTRWPWWSEAAVGGENAGRIVTVPEDGHRSARTLVADRHPQVWARYEAGAIEFAVRRLASDTPDETWVDATACPSVLVLDPRDHIDGGLVP